MKLSTRTSGLATAVTALAVGIGALTATSPSQAATSPEIAGPPHAATRSHTAPGPAAAPRHGPTGSYTGTEYDQGGVTQPINGPEPSVDAMAGNITQVTNQAVQQVDRDRAQLPYGQIYPGPHAPEQLTSYPAPTGIDPSDQYAVSLRQGTQQTSSFVYKVDARKTDTNLEADTSWTSFSFAGPVRVAVQKLAGQATGCLVRPTTQNIATTFSSNTCYFTLTRAANISVEFAPDTTNPVLHPMLVFANPPETGVPPASDPNVLYLGPGIHDLGADVQLHSGETVYIAGGAWVDATFTGTDLSNVVIKGRGVLDGLFIDTGNQDENKNQPGMIDIADSHNVVVDGITLVDAPRFNVRVLGTDITVHNIKAISWWYSTDCIWAGNYSLVEDNFCKVNDDSLKPMSGPGVIRDNVVWQLENGAPFMISWNIETNQSYFHVYDNDVIHAEEYFLSPQAIFRARHAGAATMSKYLFENIHVEDANWRLFYIILEDNKWYDPTLGYGQITDLIFRDITAGTPFTQPSVIAGVNPQHEVTNVSISNVYMDGTCADSAADGNFQIDPSTTDQIRIMKSAAGGCQNPGTR
jgi:glycosyl hydrolase family 28